MSKDVNSQSLEIIPCAPGDAYRLSDIAIRSYKDFYLYLWFDGGEWYIHHSFAPAVLEQDLKNPNHAYFLLTLDKEPIGFLKLSIDSFLKGYEQNNCLELERIYLLKSAAGKGAGSRIMDFCFRFARDRGKDIIWLKAMDSSTAVSFYKHCGFQICGNFFLDFPQMKPEFRGMVVMMKKL